MSRRASASFEMNIGIDDLDSRAIHDHEMLYILRPRMTMASLGDGENIMWRCTATPLPSPPPA
jgi:hypothetical protein